MHRYISIVWDKADRSAAEQARTLAERVRLVSVEWTTAFRCSCAWILQAGNMTGRSDAYLLSAERGVVIGTIFARNRAAPGRALMEEENSFAIMRSGGKVLIERFWGRYVAFVRDDEADSIYVVRDPSGQFKCYRWRYGSVLVYFSRLQDLVEARVFSSALDWDFLAAQFLEPEVTNGRTGFSEVTEILAGECEESHSNQTRRYFLWNPAEISRTDQIGSFTGATDALRRATELCVNGWAGVYTSILHELSGGLDSAIVLSCLTRALSEPRVSCINYFTPASSGDEREYARAAAKFASCELHEIPMSSTIDLREFLPGLERTVKPDWTLFAAPMHALASEMARKQGAHAVMTGQGGDHLFLQHKLPVIAADQLFAGKLSPSVIHTAFNTARLTDLSFWSISRLAIVHGLFRGRYDMRSARRLAAPAFLCRDAITAATSDYVKHPWERQCKSVAPGKIAQIVSLAKLLHRFPTLSGYGGAEVIHPLISQPLMEICLRIPTYVATNSGRLTRAVARTAFRVDIPPLIAQRREKGLTTSYFVSMYQANLPWIREIIAGSHLASERLIDSRLLDRYLTANRMEDPDNALTVLQAVSTALWLAQTAVYKYDVAA